MKRPARRVMVALAIIFIVAAASIFVVASNLSPQQIEKSFSIDWPLASSPLQNVLTYNGSMHIDMVLLSNGSITQGQRVIAKANGGMTLEFSKKVQQVII